MPFKWQKLPNMRKLTEKQIESAKQAVTNWRNIKYVCKDYWVSAGYLYYHWVRYKKLINK